VLVHAVKTIAATAISAEPRFLSIRSSSFARPVDDVSRSLPDEWCPSKAEGYGLAIGPVDAFRIGPATPTSRDGCGDAPVRHPRAGRTPTG
jgi:hypothetical protein